MRDPKTKVTCVKLTVSEGKALDALVADGTVKSRGDALRVGIHMLIEKFPRLWELRKAIYQERRIRPPRNATKHVRPKAAATPTIVAGITAKPLCETL